MKQSTTNRTLGFKISRCESLAKTDSIYAGFIGGQYTMLSNTERSRKAFARWLREAADKVESWK
jgi:hypothetical protein